MTLALLKSVSASHRGVPASRSMVAGWAWTIIFAIFIEGCALGPDFKHPDAPVTSGYANPALPVATVDVDTAAGTAQRLVEAMDIPGQWWTVFHSPQIDDLVKRAIAANPDLGAAKAALRVARENALAQEAAFYPTVQAGFSPSRQRNAIGTLAPTLISGAPVYSLYTAQVSVSYVLDVFGANRRMLESLNAQAELQHFEYEAALLAVTSNVVGAAIQEASLEGQIDATNQIIEAQQAQVRLMTRARELGEVSMLDVRTLEVQLAQTEATHPSRRPTPFTLEPAGKPSKMITFRALRSLQRAGRSWLDPETQA